MRFIILGLQRAMAHRSETPLQAATVSVIWLRHEMKAMAMLKVLISKWVRVFS